MTHNILPDYSLVSEFQGKISLSDSSDSEEDNHSVVSSVAESCTTEDSEFSLKSSSSSLYDKQIDSLSSSSFDQVSLLSKRKSSELASESTPLISFEPVGLRTPSFLNSPKASSSTDIALEVKRLKVNKAIFAFFKEHNVPIQAVEDPAFLQLIQAINQVKKDILM